MNLSLNSALTQLNEDGELESGSDFQSFGQCISIYFFLRVLLHAFKTLFLEHRLRFHQMAEGICDTHAKKAAWEAGIHSDSFLQSPRKQAGQQ